MNIYHIFVQIIAAIAFLGACHSAFAQTSPQFGIDATIQKWQQDSRDYVTPAARRSLARTLTLDGNIGTIVGNGYYAELKRDDKSWLKEVFGALDSSVKKDLPHPIEACVQSATNPTTCENRTVPTDHLQASFTGFSFFLLQSYPTVHVVVDPVPPRDYKVSINGDDCPPTEKGVYKVPSGNVQVSVTRPNKTPCSWTGNLSDGREQLIQCSL